jgi:hypothetical protein
MIVTALLKHHTSQTPQLSGFHLMTLDKAKTVWLGVTVTNALPYAVSAATSFQTLPVVPQDPDC